MLKESLPPLPLGAAAVEGAVGRLVSLKLQLKPAPALDMLAAKWLKLLSSAIRYLHVSKSLLKHDTKQSIIDLYQVARPFRTHSYFALQIKVLYMFSCFAYTRVVR